ALEESLPFCGRAVRARVAVVGRRDPDRLGLGAAAEPETHERRQGGCRSHSLSPPSEGRRSPQRAGGSNPAPIRRAETACHKPPGAGGPARMVVTDPVMLGA